MPTGHEAELKRLRFAPETERAFLRDYFRQSLGHTRLVVLVVFGIVAVAGVYAIGDDSGARERDWPIRYGVLCPLLLGMLVVTYWRRFRWLNQLLAAASVLILSVGLVAMDLLMSGAFEVQAHLNLLLILFATYLLVRLQFVYAVLVCWLLIAGYNAAALWLLPEPMAFQSLMTRDFFLLAANLLGMLGCRSMEEYLRRDFVMQRMLQAEQQRSERLLLNILPGTVAQRLKQDHSTIADRFGEVTVLFADIVNFTPLAARMEPAALVGLLNEIVCEMDGLCDKHGLEKIKTIGDAYMAVGGLPDPRDDHAHVVAAMALDMQRVVSTFCWPDGEPVQLRIGINTGPVVAGVIGTKKFIYDLWGDCVNIASRMESYGVAGGIQVTEATYRLLQEDYVLQPRGVVELGEGRRLPAWLLLGRRHGTAALAGPQALAAVEGGAAADQAITADVPSAG